jgi:thiosulfate/3-mercaptopyruvate sulfurtransferase
MCYLTKEEYPFHTFQGGCMNNRFLSAVALLVVTACSLSAMPRYYGSRSIDPIVSTEWLDDNRNDPDLVIIDVRSAEDYEAGHIPMTVSAHVGQWWVIRDELLLELPEDEDLRTLIGACGIGIASKVVLVGKTDSDYDRADCSRVGFTLVYAGVRNVALLDGGMNKWVAEGRQTTEDPYTPPSVVYSGSFNKKIAVSKEYVTRHLFGHTTIVDARVPGDFFGVNPLEFSEREGHIFRAVNLPTPWVFLADGTYRPVEELEQMAHNVVSRNPYKRVIVYCGVGGYAATWWWMLSEVLGYQKVRMYDGSIQEWTRDPDAPMQKFRW